ncbi:hypothetical protein KHQ82_05705 [Mycoplasmatota bacterium]|nr:hypothetical protein KHQ82_05705 [Mycoplasmatota bacterium]
MHNNSSISNKDLKSLLNIKGDFIAIDSYSFDSKYLLVNLSRIRMKHNCPRCNGLTDKVHVLRNQKF